MLAGDEKKHLCKSLLHPGLEFTQAYKLLVITSAPPLNDKHAQWPLWGESSRSKLFRAFALQFTQTETEGTQFELIKK